MASAGRNPVPEVAALNYLRFDEGRSFMAGKVLSNALNTDLDWLRELRQAQ